MIPTDFWTSVQHLGETLASAGTPRWDRETLALLKDQFEHLPFSRQCELRRDIQDVIVGLARLDASLSLESLPPTRAAG